MPTGNAIFFLSILSIQRDRLTIPASICLCSSAYEDLKLEMLKFLNEKEISYFETLQYPKRQWSYLSGRICAKRALTVLDDKLEPREVYIEHGVFDQPILRAQVHQNIQVSISHSDQLGGAIAFPEAYPMAIDIEQIDSTQFTLLENQLTINETKLLFSSQLERLAGVFHFWSAKEALSKVLRCGLTIPLHLLEISRIEKDQDFHLFFFQNFSQYKAYSFHLGNYILSLVLPKSSTLILSGFFK